MLTATPVIAVPASYFSPIVKPPWQRVMARLFAPRCPTCRARQSDAVERHGSFVLYQCHACQHIFRDIG